jgi:hypothetical protein
MTNTTDLLQGMTVAQLQEILLDLGVSCRVRCVGAGGWTVCLTWEGGAFVVATAATLPAAVGAALARAREARPLTDEEQRGVDLTLQKAKYL